MDQELMAVLNKEAQDEEKRRFEEVRLAVERLDDKRKVGIMFHGILRSVVRTLHRLNSIFTIFEAYRIIRGKTVFGVSYYENLEILCHISIP